MTSYAPSLSRQPYLTLPNRTLITIIPIPNLRTLGEAPGYFTHILENYEALEDVTIFLHGIPTAHNPDIFDHVRELTTWSPVKIGFMHLNTQWYKDGLEDHRFMDKNLTYDRWNRCYDMMKATGWLMEEDPNWNPAINVCKK